MGIRVLVQIQPFISQCIVNIRDEKASWSTVAVSQPSPGCLEISTCPNSHPRLTVCDDPFLVCLWETAAPRLCRSISHGEDETQLVFHIKWEECCRNVVVEDELLALRSCDDFRILCRSCDTPLMVSPRPMVLPLPSILWVDLSEELFCEECTSRDAIHDDFSPRHGRVCVGSSHIAVFRDDLINCARSPHDLSISCETCESIVGTLGDPDHTEHFADPICLPKDEYSQSTDGNGKTKGKSDGMNCALWKHSIVIPRGNSTTNKLSDSPPNILWIYSKILAVSTKVSQDVSSSRAMRFILVDAASHMGSPASYPVELQVLCPDVYVASLPLPTSRVSGEKEGPTRITQAAWRDSQRSNTFHGMKVAYRNVSPSYASTYVDLPGTRRVLRTSLLEELLDVLNSMAVGVETSGEEIFRSDNVVECDRPEGGPWSAEWRVSYLPLVPAM